MKVEINVKKEVEITHLHIDAGVRYWEDAKVNGIEDKFGDSIPCRDGDYWKPIILIDGGIIINWEIGNEADIHYKICDDSSYYLKDAEGNTILSIDGYVPNILNIYNDGYGDYIFLKVDKNGTIKDWPSEHDINDFKEDND